MGGGAERCATWTHQFQRALALGVNKFLWHEAFWEKKVSCLQPKSLRMVCTACSQAVPAQTQLRLEPGLSRGQFHGTSTGSEGAPP